MTELMAETQSVVDEGSGPSFMVLDGVDESREEGRAALSWQQLLSVDDAKGTLVISTKVGGGWVLGSLGNLASN